MCCRDASDCCAKACPASAFLGDTACTSLFSRRKCTASLDFEAERGLFNVVKTIHCDILLCNRLSERR